MATVLDKQQSQLKNEPKSENEQQNENEQKNQQQKNKQEDIILENQKNDTTQQELNQTQNNQNEGLNSSLIDNNQDQKLQENENENKPESVQPILITQQQQDVTNQNEENQTEQEQIQQKEENNQNNDYQQQHQNLENQQQNQQNNNNEQQQQIENQQQQFDDQEYFNQTKPGSAFYNGENTNYDGDNNNNEIERRNIISRPRTQDYNKRPNRSQTANSQWIRGGGDTLGRQFAQIKESRKELEKDALGVVHRLALIKLQEQKTNKDLKKTMRETDKLFKIKKLKEQKQLLEQKCKAEQQQELLMKQIQASQQKEIMKNRRLMSSEQIMDRNHGIYNDIKRMKQRNNQTLQYFNDIDLQRKTEQNLKIKSTSGKHSQHFLTYQSNLTGRRTAETKHAIRIEKAKRLKIQNDVQIMSELEKQMKQQLENQAQLKQLAFQNYQTLKTVRCGQLQKFYSQQQQFQNLNQHNKSQAAGSQSHRNGGDFNNNNQFSDATDTFNEKRRESLNLSRDQDIRQIYENGNNKNQLKQNQQQQQQIYGNTIDVNQRVQSSSKKTRSKSRPKPQLQYSFMKNNNYDFQQN